MTTPPRTGLRRLWYVASWRVRYWWLDTRAGMVAQLLGSLAIGAGGCWSAWQGYGSVVAFRAGEVLIQEAVAQWVVYAIMFVVSAIVSLALAPKIKGTAAQKVQAPVVEDGAVIRRIYGPVWIKDPIMLAFKPAGTVPIRKKAGKSWKLKTKWQTVGHHYQYIFQFGLCRGMLDALLAIRAGDKPAWSGQLTESGLIDVSKPELWGGEDGEGGIVGRFEVAFGHASQGISTYLAENVAPEQSGYRWRPYVTFRGGRWGNSPYPKPPAFLVSRIFNGWDGQECWYPEKAAVPVYGGYVTMLGEGWEYVVQTYAEPNTGWDDFTVPVSGWQQGGELPFSTSNTWSPMRSNIWLRRRMLVRAVGLTLNIGAENGCVVWVNGVQVGTSNPTNEPIPNNQNNPVSFEFSTTGEVEVIVKAFSEISAGSDSGNIVDVAFTGAPLLGMNIAHVLYDSLTAREMDGEAPALINQASWRAAADRLYSEQFAIGTQFIAGEETIEQFQQRLCDLAGARMSVDPTTGEWHLDLIRDDVPDDILVITDDDVLEFEEQPSLLDEAVNQVTARWTDVLRDEVRATAPVQALGAIQAFGSVNAEVLECPEVLDESLALRLAARNVDARATPLKRHALKVTRVAYRARPGQKARLQLPRRGIADMVVVLGDISRGTLRSGAIPLVTVQDVATMPETTYVIGEPGVDTAPPQAALPAPAQLGYEVAYRDLAQVLTDVDLAYQPVGAGYAALVAQAPASSVDYLLFSRQGAAEFAEAVQASWCPTATVVEGSAADDPAGGLLREEFTLAGGTGLSGVEIGSGCLWGTEYCLVKAIDRATGSITLGRGCVDTLPSPHAPGERIWFFDGFEAIDPVEYSAGQTVDLKAVTRASSDQLQVSAAPTSSVVMASRAARPYPPANVRLNGEYFPEQLTGTVTVQLSHRNRVAQGESILDYTAAGPALEAGATYTLETYDTRTEALLWSEPGVTADTVELPDPALASQMRLEIATVIGGLESWQRFRHEFIWGSLIVGEVYTAYALETYHVELEMPGGSEPVFWSIDSGSLPPGLHLVQDGSTVAAVTGVLLPTGAGPAYTFTLRATAADGNSAVRTFTIAASRAPASLLHFEGADGSTAIVDVGAPTWSNGGAGGGIANDVTLLAGGNYRNTGYARIRSTHASLTSIGSQALTVSFHVMTETVGELQCLWLLGSDSGTTRTAGLFLYADGRLGMYGSAVKNNQAMTAETAVVTPAGTYEFGRVNHVEVSMSALVGGQRTFRIFLNGVKVHEQIGNSATLNGSGFNFGQGYYTAQRQHVGRLDEARITVGAVVHTEDFLSPIAPSDYPQPAPALAVSGSLPGGAAGVPYSSLTDLVIHGAAGPFTVAIADGALPDGWSAAVNGSHIEVTGPGAAAGVYPVALEIHDAASHSVPLPLTVAIS